MEQFNCRSVPLPEPHYYIDTEGQLQEQPVHGPYPKTLSYVARVRIDNAELRRLVSVITGVIPDELEEFAIQIAIEWLSAYIALPQPEAEWKNDWVEEDVYRLMARPEILGWWKNEWCQRERDMMEGLVENYERHLKAMSQHKNRDDARYEAQQMAKLYYKAQHSFCLVKDDEGYKKLENSYAKLWPLK